MRATVKRLGFRFITIAAVVLLSGFLAFLLFYILTYSGFSHFWNALVSREILFAVKMSLFTASASTLLCLVVSLPAAYALARYDFKGKSIASTIIDAPLALPSLVVGFGLLLVFGASPIGDAFKKMGIHVVFTPLGIILAQFTVNVSAMVRVMKATFASINPRYEYVARTLGCSRVRAARKVLLPMARQGLVAAIAITWSKGIGEFGAVIMIAGSTRLKTETLPVALFMEMATGNLETAAAAASILIIISLVSLVVFEKFFRGKHVV